MVRSIRWLRRSLVLIAMLATLAATVGSALAAPSSDPSGTPTIHGSTPAAVYQSELSAAAMLTTELQQANQRADGVATLIARLTASGKDTTALTQAMAAYRTAIQNASTTLAAAQALLSAHAGFDASGNVIDPTQANSTIMAVYTDLSQVGNGLSTALQALYYAIGATPTPPTHTPPTHTPPSSVAAQLAREYQSELHAAAEAATRLQQATQRATYVDALIARLTASGKDTTALAQALAAYRTAIQNASTTLAAVQALLSAHAGFDANGNVTNADQARSTVQAVSSDLAQMNSSMNAASSSLYSALSAYIALSH